MTNNKLERFSLPALGEWHNDLLALDAWISRRTAGNQAKSLLLSKLQERESRIMERIGYLAEKRNISTEEMRIRILKGEASRLGPSEIVSDSSDDD